MKDSAASDRRRMMLRGSRHRTMGYRAAGDAYRAGYLVGWMDALNAMHCMTQAIGGWEEAYTRLADHHDGPLMTWRINHGPHLAPPVACLHYHADCGLRALGLHCHLPG